MLNHFILETEFIPSKNHFCAVTEVKKSSLLVILLLWSILLGPQQHQCYRTFRRSKSPLLALLPNRISNDLRQFVAILHAPINKTQPLNYTLDNLCTRCLFCCSDGQGLVFGTPLPNKHLHHSTHVVVHPVTNQKILSSQNFCTFSSLINITFWNFGSFIRILAWNWPFFRSSGHQTKTEIWKVKKVRIFSKVCSWQLAKKIYF